jgi:hypothetical protein
VVEAVAVDEALDESRTVEFGVPMRVGQDVEQVGRRAAP